MPACCEAAAEVACMPAPLYTCQPLLPVALCVIVRITSWPPCPLPSLHPHPPRQRKHPACPACCQLQSPCQMQYWYCKPATASKRPPVSFSGVCARTAGPCLLLAGTPAPAASKQASHCPCQQMHPLPAVCSPSHRGGRKTRTSSQSCLLPASTPVSCSAAVCVCVCTDSWPLPAASRHPTACSRV